MLWTAFTIGLFGSLHCVGMCGPIAIALPYKKENKLVMLASGLLYNLGRVTTYSFLGLFIGFIGKGVFLAGFQQWLSIGLGILMLIIALFSIPVESKIYSLSFVQKPYAKLRSLLGRFLTKNSWQALYLTGVLNGFLPCGLVYLAIVGAVSMASLEQGVAYMALFGLGTIPLMLMVSLAGSVVSIRFKTVVRKLYPVFMVAFAALLIARGLNFEVPRTFNFWETAQEVPMCH
ncbi:MAG: sulfite exporter TauE/SafE family protein [Saprospiraceae bacterium]|nr:sulfite exporter TauE/SafE family protein [Saprospiraceae bacterium]MCB9324487.1 sulfite exporter TauE/SafE family protein [Lewinellaceae bacterium]